MMTRMSATNADPIQDEDGEADPRPGRKKKYTSIGVTPETLSKLKGIRDSHDRFETHGDVLRELIQQHSKE